MTKLFLTFLFVLKIFPVVLIGDSGVGKSNLLSRFIGGTATCEIS